MAIFQTMCTSFKGELPLAVHNFASDVFKIALYTDAAALDATTTAYTTAGEVTDAAYTAGGQALTGASVVVDGTTAIMTFADTTWPGAITARGALIYNSSKSNKAVAVLDFGANKTSLVAFTVTMPPPTAAAALLRIA